MKQTLTATIILSIAAALILGLVWPEYNQVRSVLTALNERDVVLKSATSAKKIIDKISQDAAGGFKGDIEKINTALPENRDVDFLIVSVNALVQDSGLTLDDISFTGVAAGEGLPTSQVANTSGGPLTPDYGTTDVSLSLSGSYLNFVRFLTNIEKSTRLYDVQTIQIGKKENGQFGFDVSIKTYNLTPKPMDSPFVVPSPSASPTINGSTN